MPSIRERISTVLHTSIPRRLGLLAALLCVSAVALPHPANASDTAAVNGICMVHGALSFDFETTLMSVDIDAYRAVLSTGVRYVGSVDIASVAGPFAMELSAPVAAISFPTDNPSGNHAIITTYEYYHADYRFVVPGDPKSIKYFRAVALVEITTLQRNPYAIVYGNMAQVGVKVYDLDDPANESGLNEPRIQSTQPGTATEPGYVLGDPFYKYWLQPMARGWARIRMPV